MNKYLKIGIPIFIFIIVCVYLYTKPKKMIDKEQYINNETINEISTYLISNIYKDDYFIYNPSIYWTKDNNIGVISRISGHSMIPRKNTCVNIHLKKSDNVYDQIDYINGFDDYIKIFGDKSSGSSGIVNYIIDQDKNTRSEASIINPFYSCNNVFDDPYLGYEDPRVFTFRNKLWIITYFRGVNFPYKSLVNTDKMGHNMMIFPLDQSEKPVLLYYDDMKSVEKNWMPFEYEDELYVVYSINTL